MSAARIPADWEVARIWTVFGVMCLGLLILTGALWRIQVIHGGRFEKDLAQQSIRRVRLPAIRGRILDRAGRILVENRPSFDVVLYLEEIRRVRRVRTVDAVEAILDDLAARMELPRRVTRDEILIHMRRRRPLPLTVWEDLDERAVARWAEQTSGLPGVDLVTSSRRYYPKGDMAAHVLGYVGRAELSREDREPEERFHYYLPDLVGRRGLEAVFDERLRGKAGGRMVRVDVTGYRHDDLGGREPETGGDLMLTLDAGVQRLAEAALEGVTGAAVVLDPRNGEILAMASAPRFNPNSFVPSISVPEWRDLLEDPREPLLHRALTGAYAPGSVFKPITALAALRSGVVGSEPRFSCEGAITLGRSVFRCWHRSGHGPLALREAIKTSCNVYFFRAGMLCGIEPIADMARQFGFGAPTGIALHGDTPGLVPDDAWKRRRHGDAWRDGDTCNVSIGQGAILATPLQLAVMTAALANGGELHPPRLAKGFQAPGATRFDSISVGTSRRIAVSPTHLEWVRQGMRDAVMALDGTGRRAWPDGQTAAGKTGTAEYGLREAALRRGWMIAFAPYEAPRYAVVVMVDEAVSGGVTAAPRMRQILAGLLDGTPRGTTP